MNSSTIRQYLRAHVLGLVAIFIALSGTAIAGSDGPTASSSVVTDAKFKKLKRKVNGLQAQVNSPARGDLTGTYPNLQIAAGAVGTAELADNAVSRDKLQDNAVNDAKLADDSVGASELKAVSQPQSNLVNVPAGMENIASIACGAGQQILGGGGLWDSVDTDLRMLNSFPAGNTWSMNGINQDGADHGIRAAGLCLAQ